MAVGGVAPKPKFQVAMAFPGLMAWKMTVSNLQVLALAELFITAVGALAPKSNTWTLSMYRLLP